ncbi:MAG: cell wall hydrolase, partial [Lachnospiraceae bacterium]|nr:cell wall hydrolase [Lachnospiraceae bacterium]
MMDSQNTMDSQNAMDSKNAMDLQNPMHKSSLYIKAGRWCSILLCLLLSASGPIGSGGTAGAENGAEIYRRYERSKNQADSSRNTVHALTAEIKKLNRRMIKEVGRMEKLKAEVRSLEEKIRETEQKIVRQGEGEQEFLSRPLYFLFLAEKKDALPQSILAGFYLEHIYAGHEAELLEPPDTEEVREKRRKELSRLSEQKAEKEDELLAYETKQHGFDGELLELSGLLKDAEKKAESAAGFTAELEAEVAKMEAQERRQSADSGMNLSYSSITDTGNGTDYYQVSAYPYTDAELTLMAGIIQAEAGSDSYPGMIAVGSVVMNRVASPKFSDTIKGVIYAPH